MATEIGKKFKAKKFQSGMSLIEIIICLCIILIIFDLCLAEVSSLNISRKQRYEDIAYHIANKQMETLRATVFASLPGSGNISDSSLQQIPSGSGNFTVNSYSLYSGMKEIIVTVSWNDGKGESVVLKTLAGTGGINPTQ